MYKGVKNYTSRLGVKMLHSLVLQAKIDYFATLQPLIIDISTPQLEPLPLIFNTY